MNFLDGRLPDRFWDKVHPEPNSGCWLWLASCDGNGYGHVRVSGKLMLSHRVTYMAYVGVIPDGFELDHRVCSQRLCCNPAHLAAVTHKANCLRSTAFVAVNAVKTHCPKGHAYDSENTRWYQSRRYCRACHIINSDTDENRTRSREYQRRKRAALRANQLPKETP
jgi:hypothetical protein